MLQRHLLWRFLLQCLPWLLLCTACDREPSQTVRLSDRVALPEIEQRANPRDLRLSIGSIITPEQGYVYYRQLVDYLSDQLGLAITVVDPGNYRKLNTMLKNAEVDVAFVCSGTYVEGNQRFGLELLAAPVVEGKSLYYANVIVPMEGSARQLSDLRGQRMAFVDPQSRTGALVVISELKNLDTTPEDFFAKVYYTHAHDKSIHAVAFGMADAASVNSFIWDYMVANAPDLTKQVRVIERYGPYGIPPVVAAPHVAPELREKVRRALLTMHETPKGREILQGMHIDRFDSIDDHAYDSIRRMSAPNRQGRP